MIQIPVFYKGCANYFALIDDIDGVLVLQHKWYLDRQRKPTLYARTTTGLSLHRLLIPSVLPGFVRHHKDRNGLNNQRENLIIITNTENVKDRRLQNNNISGYPGVSLHTSGKWQVEFHKDRSRKYLGLYGSLEEAISVHKQVEKTYLEKTNI